MLKHRIAFYLMDAFLFIQGFITSRTIIMGAICRYRPIHLPRALLPTPVGRRVLLISWCRPCLAPAHRRRWGLSAYLVPPWDQVCAIRRQGEGERPILINLFLLRLGGWRRAPRRGTPSHPWFVDQDHQLSFLGPWTPSSYFDTAPSCLWSGPSHQPFWPWPLTWLSSLLLLSLALF